MDTDVEAVRQFREAVGATHRVRVDANMARPKPMNDDRNCDLLVRNAYVISVEWS